MILLNFTMMEFGLEAILRMIKTSKYSVLKLVSQVLRFKVENQVICLKMVNQVPSKWLTAPFIAKPRLPIRRGPS